MAKRDNSNLQIAMKALLAIIAGLLVADMLKDVVNTYRDMTSRTDLAIALGAAFFLFRIVVDNILFYEIKDATAKAYVARVLLIVLDLASYAGCYFIVAALDPTDDGWTTHADEVPSVIVAIAIIETLHAVWCVVWLAALQWIRPADFVERQKWLASWGGLSAFFAAVAWFFWCASSKLIASANAYILLGYGFVSTLAYLGVMRKHYTGEDSDYSDSVTVPPTPPGGTP